MTSGAAIDPGALEEFLGRVQTLRPPVATEPARPMAALAAELAELPIPPGGVVVIALPNDALLLRACFGCLLAAYVPVLMAPSTPAPRIAETAARLGAAAIIGTRARVGADPAGSRRVGDVDVVLCRGHRRRRYRPWQAILLTSGTSGPATGCLHDVSALLRNARRHAAAVGLTAADRVLITLPLYYSFALVGQLLGALVSGATPVLSGPPFNAGEYVGVLARERVTHASLTPILVSALLDAGAVLPPGVRALTVGGQALAPARTADLLGRHPGLELYLTYGLTQAGPRVTTLAAHREPPHRHDSVGVPVDGVRVSLRDVGRGPREQEVLVHSDTIFVDRVGVPHERSASELLPGPVLATGDLGYLDEAGYLYLTGRLTDFVEVRGEKVSLASLRAIATSLPGVTGATAAHDAVADVITLDLHVSPAPRGIDEAGLRRRLFSLLAPHERPGRLTFHDAVEVSSFK